MVARLPQPEPLQSAIHQIIPRRAHTSNIAWRDHRLDNRGRVHAELRDVFPREQVDERVVCGSHNRSINGPSDAGVRLVTYGPRVCEEGRPQQPNEVRGAFL